MLLGLGASGVQAQNTKGDRPEVRSGGARETRFKPSRKKTKSKPSYNRVKPRRYSPASSARLSKPTKANRNFYNNRNAYNNRSVSDRASAQNTRSGASFSNNRSISDKMSKRSSRSGGRITPRSSSGRANLFSQRSMFVNNRSTSQSRSARNRIVSNRSQIKRAERFGTKQNPPSVRGTVSPRSASQPFISRKSITPFAGFWNRKPKGEKPYTKGDLAGRPLRTKNFETRNPVLTNPTARPYRIKPAQGDRPYNGPIRGGYVSRSTSGKPWKGDIAGRKIKGRNYSSKRPPIGGKRIMPPPRSISGRAGSNKGSLSGGGYRSVSGKMQRGGRTANARSLGKGTWNNKGRPIAGRNVGANRNMGSFSGNMKPRKGYSTQGETYTGNIKARRREQGGGSISGGWNNNGRAIAGRHAGANGNLGSFSGNMKPRKGYSTQGETYTGNIKARRREQGGGSISGSWNNNGRSIAGRHAGANGKLGFYSGNLKPRKGYSDQGEEYTGNMKARKREQGGGSISGSWNNNGRAIAGRHAGANGKLGFYSGNLKPRKGYSDQGEEYTGNIKARKREQGGGSISGSWNNNGRAIAGRHVGANEKFAFYSGNMKPRKGPVDQGEEYTGNIKAKKPEKGGGSISGSWNNNGRPIAGRHAGANEKLAFYSGNMKPRKDPVDQGEEYTGSIKLARFKKNYLKSPLQADEALKKDRPDKTTYLVNGLQIKVKEKDYAKKPNAAKGSLPGIAPGKNSIRASEYARVMRQRWDYVRNPSSASDALKTWEPGKAFVRATNYQGNIKMQRFDLFRKTKLYPDSRFIKINKNNTDEERSLLTNFKLWWARLFKKTEGQPDHLKQKYKKPRYDKGEQGLWYD